MVRSKGPSEAFQPAPQPQFQETIWGDLKELVLQAVFRGRCAYCEVDEVVGGFGDAEHYRPKKAVHAPDVNGTMKPIDIVDEVPIIFAPLVE